MPSIAIVGAGVSGLTCALTLARRGIEFGLLERDVGVGGNAASDRIDGFRFDRGPHVVLGIPEAIRSLFDELQPELELVQHSCRSTLFYRNAEPPFIDAPLQANVHHLPLKTAAACIAGLLDARLRRPRRAVALHQREASERLLGRQLVDLFLEPYTNKRLCRMLSELDAAALDRVVRPSARRTIWNVVTRVAARPGFDSFFSYPRRGGIVSLPHALVKRIPSAALTTKAPVIEVDLGAKYLVLENGARLYFDAIVFSVPLPEMLRLIRDLPPTVRQAARSIDFASTYLVRLGYTDSLHLGHAIVRYPQIDVPFYRLSFPSKYSSDAVPTGCDSVIAEVGHHPSRRPLSTGDALRRVTKALSDLGIVRRSVQPIVADVRNVPVSHIVSTPGAENALKFIQTWLSDRGAFGCGKYGEWTDMLMPASMLSGIRAANAVTSANTYPSVAQQ